jgi:hypothetical protein
VSSWADGGSEPREGAATGFLRRPHRHGCLTFHHQELKSYVADMDFEPRPAEYQANGRFLRRTAHPTRRAETAEQIQAKMSPYSV